MPDNLTEDRVAGILDRALEECMSSIASARFSPVRGMRTDGELVSVSILVRPDSQDPETWWVTVACHAAGHLKVDWERVPLWLIDLDTREDVGIGVLDDHGRSEPFRVSRARTRSLGFLDPGQVVPLGSISYSIVGHGMGEAPVRFNPEGRSRDLEARARIDNGFLLVNVKALKDGLRGATVVFEIRTKHVPRTTLYSATFRLTNHGGREREWSVSLVKDIALPPQDGDFEMFVHLALDGPGNGD